VVLRSNPEPITHIYHSQQVVLSLKFNPKPPAAPPKAAGR
jgi:hypothetical protein